MTELLPLDYLEKKAIAIEVEIGNAQQSIVNIGNHLLEAKETVDHGQFITWVEERLGLERTAAHRYMQIAKMFSDVATLQHFDKSALSLLSVPSTPEPARVEAKQLAATGKPVTHKAAKQIVAKHKEPEPVEKPTPVPAQAPTPTPATPEPAKAVGVIYSFTEAWSMISKYQQNQINTHPGSMSAIKAFHAVSVGAPTE